MRHFVSLVGFSVTLHWVAPTTFNYILLVQTLAPHRNHHLINQIKSDITASFIWCDFVASSVLTNIYIIIKIYNFLISHHALQGLLR